MPPTSGRRRNDPDEWWAVVLALLAVLGIFWWVLGRDRFPVSRWVAALGGGSDPSALEGDRSQEFDGTGGNQGGFGLGLGGDRADQGSESETGDDGGPDVAIANRFGLSGGDFLGGDGASDQGAAGADGQTGTDAPGAAEVGATGDTTGDRGVGDLTPPPPAEDGITTSETPLPSPSPAPQAFADVPDDHWAAPFVNQVTQLGLIEGFPDNTFKPDEPVTRAQIAAVVSQTYSDRQGTVAAKSFSDVASDFWGTEAIAKTVQIEFMKGYPDGTFSPEKPISRLEALLTFVAGLKLTPSGAPDTVLGQFPDGDQVPDWARPAITAAVENKLVANPNGNTLDLQTTATRADIAAIVYQALTSENKVGEVSSPHILGQ